MQAGRGPAHGLLSLPRKKSPAGRSFFCCGLKWAVVLTQVDNQQSPLIRAQALKEATTPIVRPSPPSARLRVTLRSTVAATTAIALWLSGNTYLLLPVAQLHHGKVST